MTMQISDGNSVRETAARLAAQLDKAVQEATEAGLVTAAYFIEVARNQLRQDAASGSASSVTAS